MFESWSRPVFAGMAVSTAVAYLAVDILNNYAAEPADLEPVPFGASLFAPTTSWALSSPSTVAFLGNMTADEPVKQVRESTDKEGGNCA
jgi:hypothetical protein